MIPPASHNRRPFWRSWRIVPFASLAAVIGLGGLPCHWTPQASAQDVAAIDVPVRLTEWALTPAHVTIAAGQAIRLLATNGGALPHALAVEGTGFYAESEAIGSGQNVSLEFYLSIPGIYDLYCPIAFGQHRLLGQEGTLLVVDGNAEPAADTPGEMPVVSESEASELDVGTEDSAPAGDDGAMAEAPSEAGNDGAMAEAAPATGEWDTGGAGVAPEEATRELAEMTADGVEESVSNEMVPAVEADGNAPHE